MLHTNVCGMKIDLVTESDNLNILMAVFDCDCSIAVMEMHITNHPLKPRIEHNLIYKKANMYRFRTIVNDGK